MSLASKIQIETTKMFEENKEIMIAEAVHQFPEESSPEYALPAQQLLLQ